MLLDWIKAPLEKIRDSFVKRIGVGGFTIVETILQSRKNTRRMYAELRERADKNAWGLDVYDAQLEALRKRRKVQVLTTYKNIGSAIRGYARSLLAIGQQGRYYNVTVLDEKTTHVCLRYVGQSWPKPYSAIPDKPPRTQELIHRCRSFLTFRATPPDNQDSFITQFKNSDDEFKLKLLKPKRFEAYKAGRLKINSYAQFEKTVLFTLEELGLED